MYLKAIELRGFKSFLDKTIINLPKGMISVVGPNGAGKSNILDAIRWVLGEQSVKSLRSDKMQDVIFAGTQTRGQLGMCEVTLIIDNEDGKLDIEYTELAIKRKTYRDGESQFFINNKKCRLKDIRELLLDTGIGKEGYSIISQGKIDEIISSSGTQKRALLEEASGISKYRYKKEEGEKNLQVASENLERINDIYNEIENQIRPLKIQKEKAEKYLEYKKELQIQEINKILQTNEEYNKELGTIGEEKVKIDLEYNKNAEELNSITEKIAKLKEEQDYIIRKKEEIYNKKNTINSSISDSKMQISLKEESIKSLNKNNELLQEQIVQNSEEIQSIREKIETISQSKEEISKNISSMEESISQNKLIEEEYRGKIREINQQIQLNQQKSADIQSDISKLETRMEFVKNNISSFEKKIEEYSQKDKEYADNLLELDREIAQKDENIAQKNNEISKIQGQIEQNNTYLANFDEENQKISSSISENNLNLKDLTAKTDMLETFESDMQGFSKNVKTLLKNKELEGLDNVVANVITVQRGYEKAIEQLLYGRLENIIIEKSIHAKKAIDYLKREKLGRTTFLPLDVIKPAYLDYNDKGIKAIDVVSFEPKYKNIIANLLGRLVIVDDIDTALEISAKYNHSFKISTKDGDIFNIGGSITGGHSTYSKEIFSRRNTIIENKEKISKIKTELERLELQSQDITSKISKVIDENSTISNSLKSLQEEKEQYQNQKIGIEAKKEHILLLKSQIEEEKQEIVTSNDKAIIGYENDEKNLKILQSEFETMGQDFSQSNSYLEEKNEDLSKIVSELNDMQLRYSLVNQELSTIETQLTELNATLQNSNAKTNNSKNKIEANNNSIVKLNQDIEILNIQSVDFEKSLEELQKKSLEISQGEQKTRDELNSLSEAKEDLTANHNTLQSQKLKIENEESKIYYKMQLLYENLAENYEMDMAMAMAYKDNSVKVNAGVIKKLKEDIASLGNVNVDSIEEYARVEERYLLYKNQKTDLEESIAKINSIIRTLERSMIHDFKENFEIINNNFNDIFKILFGGGSGKLILEDEDDVLNSNIDISVQPPGKKLKGLSMLSGGEKALSAIALLFAIIAKKPVPFCILDEIDAPLDDANIHRYITYLSTLSDTTQFVTITHRRITMEASDYIYGVTMQEKGISNVVSLKLEDAQGYVED